MNEKINSKCLFTSIISLSGAFFYSVYSSYLLKTSLTDSIISMILGYLISLIFLKIIFNFFDKNGLENKSKFTKFILVILSLIIYSLFAYRLCSFLSTQYLLDRPKIIIMSMICLLTYYIASKGFETIARVSIISFIVGIVLLTFDIIFLSKEINISNFFPMFISKPINIIKPALMYSVLFSGPVFYINYVSKDNISDKENIKKYFYISSFVSFIITLLCLITTIGVLGVDLCNMFDYPLYTVLKKISVFNFLESIENVGMMIWFLYIINASSITLYFSLKLFNEIFNVKNKRSNIFILLLCIVSPLILFSNNIFVETYKYLLIPFSILLTIILINLKTK